MSLCRTAWQIETSNVTLGQLAVRGMLRSGYQKHPNANPFTSVADHLSFQRLPNLSNFEPSIAIETLFKSFQTHPDAVWGIPPSQRALSKAPMVRPRARDQLCSGSVEEQRGFDPGSRSAFGTFGTFVLRVIDPCLRHNSQFCAKQMDM